jgi:hypothetical protein
MAIRDHFDPIGKTLARRSELTPGAEGYTAGDVVT